MNFPNIPSTEVLNSKDYIEFCNSIKELPRYHRKQWEFFVIQKEIMEHFEFSIVDKKGLGFAVGQEVLLPYFVSKGAIITGTDLDPNKQESKGWIATNQHLSNNIPLNDIISENEFKEKFKSDFVDMNYIPKEYLNENFDFIWSSCSLEHLGSTQKGFDFIFNSLECLKPGGIAVHTTEYNLGSETDHFEHSQSCVYSKYMILDLINKLRLIGYNVKPIQFERENNTINNHIDKYPYSNGKSFDLCSNILTDNKNTHLNLLIHGNVISTSIYFVITKH